MGNKLNIYIQNKTNIRVNIGVFADDEQSNAPKAFVPNSRNSFRIL